MTLRLAALAAAALVALTACGTHAEPGLASGLQDDAGASDAGAPVANHDAGQSVDALADEGVDSPSDLLAPRPLSPLSTSRVTSRRPTLRWVLPSGVADATIDLCLDRACTMPAATPAHVTGSSYAPEADLPVGVVFWRLHPSNVTSVTSPTWQLTVGARSAPVDSSWGTTLDVNGDGYADVVVGQPGGTGAALVYLGGATGLATAPATTLFGFAVGAPYAGFGSSVAGAGDVNGDGFADLVVTTSADSLVGVYVYPGGAAGLATAPLTTLFPPNVDAMILSAASAGDVNGDGYADLVVDAESTAYVYLGGPSGLATTPATTLTFGDAATETATSVVTSAGDVNGDGFGDLVASTFGGPDASGFMAGGYVYLGSKTGIATTPTTQLAGVFVSTSSGGGSFNENIAGAGDVNGDGYADIIAAACDAPNCAWVYLGRSTGIDPKPAATITPAAGGIGRVAGAGDVNGDGYGDVAVEQYTSQGAVLVAVYLGGAGGVVTTAAATPTEPESMADNFGSAFASAGDVNGDGFADLIAGADYGVPGNAPDPTGSAYVYLGSAKGVAATAATTLVGTEGESGLFGSAVFGASN